MVLAGGDAASSSGVIGLVELAGPQIGILRSAPSGRPWGAAPPATRASAAAAGEVEGSGRAVGGASAPASPFERRAEFSPLAGAGSEARAVSRKSGSGCESMRKYVRTSVVTTTIAIAATRTVERRISMRRSSTVELPSPIACDEPRQRAEKKDRAPCGRFRDAASAALFDPHGAARAEVGKSAGEPSPSAPSAAKPAAGEGARATLSEATPTA